MTPAADLKTLRFEPLSQARIPEILVIERRANSLPWSERSFANELENPQSLFVVALINGKVAAYAGVWLCFDEAHVTTVAVSPEWQRRGIGERCVRRLLEQAGERGAACSTLEVRASNEPAIRLYEKLGYLRTAVRKRYYPDNAEDAVVMWLHSLDAFKA